MPQRKILEVLPSSGDAMGLALAADGQFVYVANGEDRTVSKVDARAHRIVATGKVKGVNHDVVLTPDGRSLYVTMRKANRIAVLRADDLEVVTEIPQPGYPDLVVMSNDGTKAYVSNRQANVVTVIGLSDHREIKRIPVGKGPHGMALCRLPASSLPAGRRRPSAVRRGSPARGSFFHACSSCTPFLPRPLDIEMRDRRAQVTPLSARTTTPCER